MLICNVLLRQTFSGSRFTISASNPNLNKPATVTSGSMKIANEVIEEVDEQTTITSMGKRPENRYWYYWFSIESSGWSEIHIWKKN